MSFRSSREESKGKNSGKLLAIIVSFSYNSLAIIVSYNKGKLNPVPSSSIIIIIILVVVLLGGRVAGIFFRLELLIYLGGEN